MKNTKPITYSLLLVMIFTCVLSFGRIDSFAQSTVTVYEVDGHTVAQIIDEDGNSVDAKFEIKNADFGSNHEDATNALTDAFSFTKENASDKRNLIISVPDGFYDITKNIVLTSYTTLNLNNATLYNYREKVGTTGVSEKGNIFISPNSGPKNSTSSNDKYVVNTGFDGLTNFTINGGILDYDSSNNNGSCLMRLAHCKNITINNTAFKNNYNSHHIEIAACKDISFNGCLFEGQVSDYSQSSSEALQIDILEENTHFSNFQIYDGTMSENVTVQNCTFKNLVAGVGTRSAFVGRYQNNVKIINNTFENISASAIVCTNYINSTIDGNTITNCGEGISYYMDKQTGSYCYYYNDSGELQASRNTNCKTSITNNTISVSKTTDFSNPRAIYVYGANNSSDKSYPTGNYAVYGLNLSNNTVKSSGNGINTNDLQNCTVSGNNVKYTNGSTTSYYGINLSQSDGNNVSANTIDGFKYGVCLEGASSNNVVNSNSVSASTSHGIALFNKSNNNVVSANAINKTGDNGIYVNASTYVNINSNSITSTSDYGIQLNSSAVADIYYNTLSSTKKSAVTISNLSQAQNVFSNIIQSPSGNGIYANNATITNLTSNTISGCTQQGINISTSSYAYNVSGNNISSTGASGIRLYKSNAFTLSNNTISATGDSSVKIDTSSDATYVNGNQILYSNYNGITVASSSNANQVMSNSISKSKNDGIAVTTSSSANVKSNSISSSGRHGLYITNASKTTATSNKIKSSGNTGIYISNKAAATLKSNSISSSQSNGIYVGSNTASISSNTLTSNKKYGIYTNKGATVTVYNNTYKSNKSGTAYSKGSKKSYKFSNMSKPKTPSLSKSNTNITVKWSKVSNATGYLVYRSTSKSGTYKKIATLSSSKRSYLDKSKKSKGKTYYYKVVAIRKMNKTTSQSAYSPYKSKKI